MNSRAQLTVRADLDRYHLICGGIDNMLPWPGNTITDEFCELLPMSVAQFIGVANTMTINRNRQ